jgi:hypothetical protein
LGKIKGEKKKIGCPIENFFSKWKSLIGDKIARI